MAKLKVLSFAIFQAILTALIGLIAGILYSFGGFFVDLFTIGLNKGTALAFLALIGMPLIFGVLGFTLGLVEALFYNLFEKWLSRFKPDFK